MSNVSSRTLPDFQQTSDLLRLEMVQKVKRKPTLTLAEKRLVLRFTEDPLGYPRQAFDTVAKRLLGPKGFPSSKNKDLLIQRCRRAYRMGPK
jgi:hypothetical protein